MLGLFSSIYVLKDRMAQKDDWLIQEDVKKRY